MKTRVGTAFLLPEATDGQKEEKKNQIKHWQEGKGIGNNCQHLARVLLANNPLCERLPECLSWQQIGTCLARPDKNKGKTKGAARDGAR
jgi:hypothetical protein